METNLISSSIIDVIENFNALNQALSNFAAAILQDITLPGWVDNLPKQLQQHSCPRRNTITLLNQLEYLDNQLPRSTLLAPGILAASPNTIDAAHNLNLSKNNFKAAVLTLKAKKIPIKHPGFQQYFTQQVEKRSYIVSYSLHKTGLARLHLKQCYRQIPILQTAPKKVSWTWANTRAIVRITKAQAFEKLKKFKQDEGILQQIAKLNSLSSNEPLAIVQELAPHLRTNILFDEKAPRKRIMVKGPIPILYPYAKGALPTLTKPKPITEQKSRHTRSDVKINPEPFLPALHVHRYMEILDA